jgi:hypothetical protein
MKLKQTDIGVLRVEALRVSKNIVKAELKAKGIRLSEFRLSELNALARQWFEGHRAELIGDALGSLCWHRLCDSFQKLELSDRSANAQSAEASAIRNSATQKVPA